MTEATVRADALTKQLASAEADAATEQTEEASAPPPTAAAAASAGAFGATRSVKVSLFLDDEVATFYRRPDWSPDGAFLLLPCGPVYKSSAFIF